MKAKSNTMDKIWVFYMDPETLGKNTLQKVLIMLIAYPIAWLALVAFMLFGMMWFFTGLGIGAIVAMYLEGHYVTAASLLVFDLAVGVWVLTMYIRDLKSN